MTSLLRPTAQLGSYRGARVVLGAAVPTAGTFVVGYPTGFSRASFVRGTKHRMTALGTLMLAPASFTVALNAASATVTYNGATTLPAGTEIWFEFDTGAASFRDGPDAYRSPQTVPAFPVVIDLGNPVAASANAILLSAAITAAAPVTTFTGAAAVAGAVTLDVPRNVVAAWTTTAVMTVDGFDIYGQPMRESSASGTSMTGAKAFSRITRVAVSANVTGCTVGTGTVLGLPIRLLNAANVVRETLDNATATAGTLVAGLAAGTVSTATTADVRGTYVPNSAPDGSRCYALYCLLTDPADYGNPQFAG